VRGVDTNVLVRFLTADDPQQSPQANRALVEAEKAGQPLHINSVVLCELLWTLRSAPYGLDRPALAEAVDKLFSTAVFELQDRDLVRQALADFRTGRADFPDYLIGRLNQQAGCIDTLTFDQRLAREQGFVLVSKAIAKRKKE
jgi:predicted nucleic-acid-binding protein